MNVATSEESFSDEMEEQEINMEQGQFCFGVVGNSLILCSSPKFMEKAIETERGESPALVDEEGFVETTDTIVKLIRNDMPGAIFYSQPEAGFEMMFDLAKGDDIKGILSMIEDGEEDASTLHWKVPSSIRG